MAGVVIMGVQLYEKNEVKDNIVVAIINYGLNIHSFYNTSNVEVLPNFKINCRSKRPIKAGQMQFFKWSQFFHKT